VLSAKRIDVTSSFEEEAEMKKVVSRYMDELDHELAVVLGRSSVDLDARTEAVRLGEANVGEFILQVLDLCFPFTCLTFVKFFFFVLLGYLQVTWRPM
jgi:hypothetical protein